MDEIKIVCDECNGFRYTDEVLDLKYNGKNIYDVLKMTVEQASEFFHVPEIKHRLNVLIDVGLSYLEIGQPLSTLSGGEAQYGDLSQFWNCTGLFGNMQSSF